MTEITRAQYEKLIEGIHPNRVSKNAKGQSHVEAWDVRRHLIRIFGFGGFDIETIRCDLVKEIENAPGTIKYSDGKSNQKPIWTIVYRAEVRLTVKAPDGTVIARYEDGATGDAVNQPSLGDAHDMAMKTALSQGLKRCAVNLGDQFGLSLYNGGRPDPVVHRSLIAPEGGPASSADLPVDDAPVMPEPGPATEQTEPAPADSPDLVQRAARRAGVRMVEQSQHARMNILWKELGFDGGANRSKRLEAIARILDLPSIETSKHLTFEQAEQVIRAQEAKKRHAARTNGKVGASA